MPPANEAPRHQVERVMLITRPRSRAGQVSATSIEPSDHSPFSAKPTKERAMTKVANVGDNATTGISSENSAMLTASKVRRPRRSESHGQKYSPAMPTNKAICRPERYSGTVSENSLITIGETSAKITPSIPSKPQPSALATAICQWVFETFVPSLTARRAAPLNIQPLLNLYPLPNRPERPDGLAESASSFANAGRHDAGSLRIDTRPNDKLSLSGYLNITKSSADERGAGGFSAGVGNSAR